MPLLGSPTEHREDVVGLLPEAPPIDQIHMFNDNLGQIKRSSSPSPKLVHRGQRLLIEPLRLRRWIFWPGMDVIAGDEVVELVLQIAATVIRMKPQTSYFLSSMSDRLGDGAA